MTAFLVGVLLAASHVLSETQDAPATVHLLKAQDYYGRHSFAGETDVWLGIYRVDNGGWELKASRISVEIVPTPKGCVPEVTRVSVGAARAPLFLVQGLQNVLEGPIDVAFVGALFLYPGQSRSFSLGS